MASTEQDDRLKALTRTLADIERAFGKGSIMKLGDRMGSAEENLACRWMPSPPPPSNPGPPLRPS